MAVFIVAAVGFGFLLQTGSTRQLSGMYGEDNTRDVLRRARRRRHIWGWIDNVEVQNTLAIARRSENTPAPSTTSRSSAVALRAWLSQRPSGPLSKQRAEHLLAALHAFKAQVGPSRTGRP